MIWQTSGGSYVNFLYKFTYCYWNFLSDLIKKASTLWVGDIWYLKTTIAFCRWLLAHEVKLFGNRNFYYVKRYIHQGSQYCIGGCTGLASSTIYFGYRSIQVYRFGFTAIFYIYKYMCVCVCVCVRARVWCIYYNKYKSLS